MGIYTLPRAGIPRKINEAARSGWMGENYGPKSAEISNHFYLFSYLRLGIVPDRGSIIFRSLLGWLFWATCGLIYLLLVEIHVRAYIFRVNISL